MRTLFARMFPVPRALALPMAGVDVADDAISAVSFRASYGEHFVAGIDTRPLPEGAVRRGSIAGAGKVADALGAVRDSCGITDMFASLPDEHAFFIKLQVPALAPAALRESIRFQLEEHVPLPPEQLIFDYEEVPGASTGGTTVVVVSAYPKKLAGEYLDAFTLAGMRPHGFEVRAQSVARASFPVDARGVTLLVCVDYSRTSISFVNGGVVWFNTVIPLGGRALEDAIQKSMQMDATDARKELFSKGLSRAAANKKTFSVLVQSASALRDEVANVKRFWHAHRAIGTYEAPDLAHLVLTGAYARVPDLDEYVSSGVGIAAEVGLPWRRVPSLGHLLPPVAASESGRYGAALGLALRGMTA